MNFGKIVGAALLAFAAFIALRVVLGTVSSLISLAVLIFTIVAFVDAMIGQPSTGAKVVWGVVILFVPFFGALAYWLVARDTSPSLS